jgi:phosphatidylglycerophosphatase C
MKKNNDNVVAIFDFDGTLTKGDTLIFFLIHTFGLISTLFGLLYNSPYILGFMLGFVSNNLTKKKVLFWFFNNESIAVIDKKVQKFINNKLKNYLRGNVIKQLRFHQNSGHVTILISASIDVYIKPWAKKNNFDYIECTELKIKKNQYSGEIIGKNCHGIEKVNRIKKIFPKGLYSYTVYGYGDSKSDKHLLDLCDHSYYKNELNTI